MCLAGNGVVQATGLNIAEAKIRFLALFEEEAHQQLVGIGAILIDIVAGVSAGQAFHDKVERRKAFGQFFFVHGVGGFRAYPTGTTYEELSFVLRVEVDEIVARHKSGFHLESSRQTGFFVTREHAFDRAVLDIRGLQQCHFHGDADTIIGAERCALCLEPIAVHIGLDRVVVEVKFYVLVLFADHILVALQNDRLAVFVTGRTGFANQHIAGFIHQRFEAKILTKFTEEGSYLFLALRRTRNFVDLREAIEYGLRL